MVNQKLSFPGERRTAGNSRDATENTRKLEAVFRSGISRIFSGDFPASFLEDPARSCGRNDRPG